MVGEGEALNASEVRWKEGTRLTRLIVLHPQGQQQPEALPYQTSLPKGLKKKKYPFETTQGKEALPLSNILG